MKKFLKQAGLFLGGAGCVVVSVLFPPAAPFLGPIATKLLIAGAGVTALAAVSPQHVKDGIQAIKDARAAKKS